MTRKDQISAGATMKPREWWLLDMAIQDPCTNEAHMRMLGDTINQKVIHVREVIGPDYKSIALELMRIFDSHLHTMGAINEHLGYPFSSPLINAHTALSSAKAKLKGDAL